MLLPLYRLFSTTTSEARCDIIGCYTAIVRRYLTYNFGSDTKPPQPGLTGPLPEANYMLTLHELLTFVDGVCDVAVRVEPQGFALQDAVLNFYELTSVIHSRFGLPMTLVPCQSVVYACVLSPSGAVISRLCAILTRLRDEVRSVSEAESGGSEINGLDNAEYLNYYNQDLYVVALAVSQRSTFATRSHTVIALTNRACGACSCITLRAHARGCYAAHKTQTPKVMLTRWRRMDVCRGITGSQCCTLSRSCSRSRAAAPSSSMPPSSLGKPSRESPNCSGSAPSLGAE